MKCDDQHEILDISRAAHYGACTVLSQIAGLENQFDSWVMPTTGEREGAPGGSGGRYQLIGNGTSATI